MICSSRCRWALWYYGLLVLNLTTTLGRHTSSENDTAGIIDGDIVLGGLFRIRRMNGTNKCDEEVEPEVGIQRVEAMLYAIHEVNKDKNLLPNVKLGAEIRDTCSMKTKALDESLKFILDSMALRSNSQQSGECLRNNTKDVVGVIGASRSTMSIEVAKLLRLFKVPQVSYASTSSQLSNKNKYSYFARTVPPDSLQAQAMLHVIREFQWTSVFTINSAGSYGETGIEEFKRLTTKNNFSVCVVFSEQVTDTTTRNDYYKIIQRFTKFPSTRVVVLFLKDNHLKMLLQAAKKHYESTLQVNNVRKVWIASDEWGVRMDIVKNMGDFFKQSDAITITLPSPKLPVFETYFRNLSKNNPRIENPWFQQYLYQCSSLTCNFDKLNDKLPYVIDAVYAFAHALHDMYQEKCPEMSGLCHAMKPVNGTELRDRILKISFNGSSSCNVSFDDHGDSKGKYILFHYTKRDQYQNLGEWQDKLSLRSVPTRLRNITSTCDDTCNIWSRNRIKQGTTCCSECFECPNKEQEYFDKENKCVECGTTERPNANYTDCENLPLIHVSREWFISITLLACLGATFTLIVSGLLLYNINTPIVKACERDLTFLLLFGVFLSYVLAIVFVSKASVITCVVQRFGRGFSATICYASLLVKVERIGRIFATQNIKSVHFNKPHTHLVVVFLLIAIEVSLAFAGLIIQPPEVVNVLPTKKHIFAKCNYGTLEYITSTPYNLLLILLCAIYSFRIRKTSCLFNEVKYIGLVMYSTCVIWLAFLPVYLGTPQSYEPITLGLNTVLSATTILVCLFGPKVYILVFRPFRNAERSSSVTVNNCGTDQQQSKVTNQSRHVRTEITAKAQKTSANSLNTRTSQNKECEEIKLKNRTLSPKDIVNQNTSTLTDQKKSEQMPEHENS